jgi:ADP-heptose:LPS heptosyltransferase
MLRHLPFIRDVLVRFVKTGPAIRRPAGTPSRVLIVQMAKLGDMVCTTPMFKAVKGSYPDCRVDVLGRESNRDLLQHDPSVDCYLSYSDDHQGLREQIRANAYDFACCTGPNAIGAYLLYTAGVPFIALPEIRGGRSPYETASYRFIRRFCVGVAHDMTGLAVKQYLRLLKPLGIHNASVRKRVHVSPEGLEQARAFLTHYGIDPQAGGIVGISPSAGNKLKLWDAEKFAAVAGRLSREDGRPVVVIGSPRDRAEVDEMWRSLPQGTQVVNAAERFDLDGFMGLMAHFDVFISVDSGPIYIADALGVGTVDIVGPFASQTQRPMDSGRNVEVRVDGLHCRPCSFVMDAKRTCWTGTHACTREISVEMVLAAVRKLSASPAGQGWLTGRMNGSVPETPLSRVEKV